MVSSTTQADGEREQCRSDDRDAYGAGDQRSAPKPIMGLFGLALDQNDQVSQVAGRLGQTALTEPCVDRRSRCSTVAPT